MDDTPAVTLAERVRTLRSALIFSAKAAMSFSVVFLAGLLVLGMDVTGGIEQRSHAVGLRSAVLNADLADAPGAPPARWAQTPAPQEVSQVAWFAREEAMMDASGEAGEIVLLGGPDGDDRLLALAPSRPVRPAPPPLRAREVAALAAPAEIAFQADGGKRPKS